MLLVVDGYNVAHAWAETKGALARREPLEEVRRRLVASLGAYAVATGVRVVVVFDSPRRRDAPATPPESVDGVEVRFGGQDGSADHAIERLVYDATRDTAARTPVRVASGDRLIRDMVRAMGAETVTPLQLEADVAAAVAATARTGERLRDSATGARRLEHRLPADVLAQLEALRRGEPPPPPARRRGGVADARPGGRAPTRPAELGPAADGEGTLVALAGPAGVAQR